ncbi:MAG: aminodeoxychorismate/anthranilate synthase component II [Gemmataceae bacterium]|nr:aminodeoxychorismate/anthranilate synthase component II [Gemmataceae bacterium]MDW8264088.1 aminodeoxychorismate/anthranilate synthase component II [Gemmataceae bacterium]
MILLIDNYDSFTYNLVQRLGEMDPTIDLRVVRNDQISVEDIAALRPSHIIISPGPCTPNEAGISNDVIRRFASSIPILGVCLGHQCIGQVFGGEIVRNYRVMHGKTSLIHHDNQGVFHGLAQPFEATRYHSLVIRRETFSHPDLVISAWTDEGEIMGVRHRTWPLHGVQFHPESFLTLEGPKLLRNFVNIRSSGDAGSVPHQSV